MKKLFAFFAYSIIFSIFTARKAINNLMSLLTCVIISMVDVKVFLMHFINIGFCCKEQAWQAFLYNITLFVSNKYHLPWYIRVNLLQPPWFVCLV